MSSQTVGQSERRKERRFTPRGNIRALRPAPVMPLADAEVLNVSASGVALKTRTPVPVGDRLSFTVAPGTPPVLAEVLACENMDAKFFRIRCKCILGGFDSRAGVTGV